ncbi:HesA/MoeB/ThiF family protein [Candidatus Venteria ishoeyi]|uniref:Molybdopterin-synthase adenylyltransferase n=1 Tax=Candidatus Venteria ishoeyi TaxID=1899563 RepID=A0A1H6FFZ4_9GAMM|nr:molybdopterin-synthase adenylyltransferase MoeB [Candidatus Venteria ishoeyi]MDM8545869.1 molybdopterin-synthase adenylyltransferase MoeB [Candidatus Venteria ishoeyi]SEH08331.1 Molybdopterin-synthase adenylyltransferase [Candidatus Venteria ishoeyi]
MDTEQQKRYARQIALPGIGPEGQEKLLAARVLIIGMGGLGSPAAIYLATAGVGHLVLSDYDRVELSNLQRQIVHNTQDIGELKVASARQHLQLLNPDLKITTLDYQLVDEELHSQIQQADVVLDCSDNFSTRFAINRVCVKTGTPLVSGAAIGFEGQISVFLPDQADSPCYHCIYQDNGQEGDSCSQLGILAPLVGVIGSMQAVEALKLLLGIGDKLCGRLLLLDGLHMDWRTLKVRRDPKCAVCGQVSHENTV